MSVGRLFQLALGAASAGLLFAAACGDGKPDSCDLYALTSVYFIAYEHVSGDCATPEDRLARFDADLAPGCADTEPPRETEGGCVLEENFECTYPDGQIDTIVSVTRQEDEDGARLSGLYTVTAVSAAGEEICTGTFRVSAARQ